MTQDVGRIAAAIDAVMTAHPGISLLDIEMVFRQGRTSTYLVACPHAPNGCLVCLGGLPNLLAQLSMIETTPQTNRVKLALLPEIHQVLRRATTTTDQPEA